jgi:excinuclease ABC subunit C
VYLFRDKAGTVVYVGKAKNIRRRLQTYRNTGRKKRYRKQRAIVRASHTLEIEPQPSEAAALLRENELIRHHRPQFNVEGAYYFMYPAIAIGTDRQRLLIGITTDVDGWRSLNLRFFGVYRSRIRAMEAFDALTALLTYIGHREPARRLPTLYRPTRGARLHAYRRLSDLEPVLAQFLAGDTAPPLTALSPLIFALLERRSAREEAQAIEAHLQTLARFERSDIAPLHAVLASTDRTFVAQEARDALFIAHNAKQAALDEQAASMSR